MKFLRSTNERIALLKKRQRAKRLIAKVVKGIAFTAKETKLFQQFLDERFVIWGESVINPNTRRMYRRPVLVTW